MPDGGSARPAERHLDLASFRSAARKLHHIAVVHAKRRQRLRRSWTASASGSARSSSGHAARHGAGVPVLQQAARAEPERVLARRAPPPAARRGGTPRRASCWRTCRTLRPPAWPCLPYFATPTSSIAVGLLAVGEAPRASASHLSVHLAHGPGKAVVCQVLRRRGPAAWPPS